MSKIVSLVAVLMFVLPAAAFAQDFRSPDARSAAAVQDYRSADARPATASGRPYIVTDGRSPDARPVGHVVPATPSSAPHAGGSFDWGYLAVIVAALLCLGGLVVMQRRRRHGFATGH